MPASEQKKAPGIFISYRRSDNPDAVGRMYDRLVAEFGRARVFKDVDSIPLGLDFRSHLNDIVGGCAAVLAVIGPRWLDIRNESGAKRLEDPDDFVRIELEAALARSVPVVPVLVGHAAMPGSAQLPASLATLVYRQSIEVRPDPDFHHDCTRLVTALRQILDPGAEHIEPATAPAAQQGVQAARATPLPLKWIAAFAISALAAAALAVPAWKHLYPQPLPEIRTEIVTPPTDVPGSFALSPDGRYIVFVARDDAVSRLWLRPLSSSAAQPLRGTEGAMSPFWSPDSRAVGFFAEGALKRVDIGGGQPQTLNSALSFAVSGAWNREGTILFSGMGQPFMRLAAAGGEAIPLESASEIGSAGLGAVFLPDGRRFLYVRRDDVGGTYLGELGSSKSIRLMTETPTLAAVGATSLAYLPSGWLLWTRSDTLMAQRLDIDKGVLQGDPVKLAENVISLSAATDKGLIAYRGASHQRQLVWVDRSGRILATLGDGDASVASPRLSPDGRRVAVSRTTQNNVDIWVLDGARASRMTFDQTAQTFPVWSSDGSRIAYLSGPNAASPGNVATGLYQKLASGAGAQEQLLEADNVNYPSSWSPDGRYLLYFTVRPGAVLTADISVLPTTGDRKPFFFVQSAAREVWGQFSPDGRWVAYQSDESGRNEVYIRPFLPPGSRGTDTLAAAQWQVSANGGIHPLWSRDGKELYFIDPAGGMMAAPIQVTGNAIAPGTPQRLFDSHIVGGGIDQAQGRQYDVAADGRFLINMEGNGSAEPITLLQNWNPPDR